MADLKNKKKKTNYVKNAFNLMRTHNDIRNSHLIYDSFTLALREQNSCISN